jgi:hypothetical protein
LNDDFEGACLLSLPQTCTFAITEPKAIFETLNSKIIGRVHVVLHRHQESSLELTLMWGTSSGVVEPSTRDR